MSTQTCALIGVDIPFNIWVSLSYKATLHTAVCTLLVKNIHTHTLNLTFVLNMWDNTTPSVNRTHISLQHTLPFVLYWLEHTYILNPEHVRPYAECQQNLHICPHYTLLFVLYRLRHTYTQT